MERWVNLRYILYKNIYTRIDNPSENADMSNEKGSLLDIPRLKLMDN